jgi:hypothetical protein
MRPLRERIFNPLNLHLSGLGLLVIVNLVLVVRLIVAWHTLGTSGPEQLAAAQFRLRTLQLQMLPLRGLPEKVDQTRDQAAKFYDDRFPGNYSTISAAVGDLASKNNVRLTRVSYIQTPAIPGLLDVRMDASLSGEYAPLMHFINGLERSKTFFLINGLTLTGQQGGMVNLRLRLTTYLHPNTLENVAPPPTDQDVTSSEETQ